MQASFHFHPRSGLATVPAVCRLDHTLLAQQFPILLPAISDQPPYDRGDGHNDDKERNRQQEDIHAVKRDARHVDILA